jgi:chromosome segregation ATPase
MQKSNYYWMEKEIDASEALLSKTSKSGILTERALNSAKAEIAELKLRITEKEDSMLSLQQALKRTEAAFEAETRSKMQLQRRCNLLEQQGISLQGRVSSLQSSLALKERELELITIRLKNEERAHHHTRAALAQANRKSAEHALTAVAAKEAAAEAASLRKELGQLGSELLKEQNVLAKQETELHAITARKQRNCTEAENNGDTCRNNLVALRLVGAAQRECKLRSVLNEREQEIQRLKTALQGYKHTSDPAINTAL